MWVRDSGATVAKAMADGYNSFQDESTIKVTVIPAGQYLAKLGNAIAAGNPPDLATTDFTYVALLGSTNQFIDITDRAEALDFYPDGLSQTHLRAGTFEEKVYAMPFSGEASILVYNKDLFAEAGLDPETAPSTWDEIKDAAAKITALGDGKSGFYFAGQCAGCNTFTLLPLMWASGGDILNEDGTAATIEGNEALRGALTLYKEMWDAGSIDPSAQSDNGSNWTTLFMSGNVGMMSIGAFGISALRADYPDIDFGVGYLPGNEGDWSSYAGGDDIGIPQGAQNVEGAWDFIEWSLQTEQQVENLAKNDVVPVRTDDALTEYQALDPRYVVTGSAEAEGRAPYSTYYEGLFNDLNGPFGAMVQRAVFDGDVDGAMEQAQADFTKILEGN